MFLANLFLKATIVSREEWAAEKPRGPIAVLKPEVDHLVITFTDTPACSSKQECSQRVREIQNKHIEENGEEDISHNFLIGGDGNVYEGRGWKLAPKYRKRHKNFEPLKENAIEVALIGDKDHKPTAKMVKAMLGLILQAVKNKVIVELKQLKPCLLVDGEAYYLREEFDRIKDSTDKKKLLEQFKKL